MDMKELKEMKRKLSALLGINLFEERFKEIDNILGAQKSVEVPTNTETYTTDTTSAAEKAETADPPTEEQAESAADASTEQAESEQAESADDGEHTAQSQETGTAEDEQLPQETEQEPQEPQEPSQECFNESSASEPSVTDSALQNELFDAKLEAKLLRANIREDKLDAAKKLFKADHTLADINKVEKWVKDYPEWFARMSQPVAKGFGMAVGEIEGGETAEEKRLKELGIVS